MQETRTHGFTLSSREVREALKKAFPENLRIATMPENFTVEVNGGSGLSVRYTLAVQPNEAHRIEGSSAISRVLPGL